MRIASLHLGLVLALTAVGAAGPLAVATSTPALAQSQIRVVVDGEPITSNEINQRARFLRLVDRSIGNNATQIATNELIEDKLKLKEGQIRGITASDQAVEQAYAGIAQRVRLTPAQLTAALQRGGVDPLTLRQRLRAQLVWQQLVLTRFRQTVTVSDRDIVAALQAQQTTGTAAAGARPAAGTAGTGTAGAGAKPVATSTEYRLSQVIFVIPAAQRAAMTASRTREAEQLRAKVTSCDQLEASARGFREVVVKPLGRKLESELPQNYLPVLKETPVGRLTKPIENVSGLELIAVCAREEIQSDASARAKVEDDLRQREGERLARRYINELKQRAVIDYKGR